MALTPYSVLDSDTFAHKRAGLRTWRHQPRPASPKTTATPFPLHPELIPKESLHACQLTNAALHNTLKLLKLLVYDPVMLRSMTHGPNDDERRGAASEWTVEDSSLDQENSNDQRKRERGCFCAPQLFGGGIYLPDPSTYDPIEILLNTHDKNHREELTRKWRDNKLSELNFVGVVSALLAGVLTSTGSWPTVLPNGKLSPWSVRTSWYCGIILSLMSIISAADQTVRLHRLSSHRDGLANIHKLLGKGSHTARTGRRAPSLLQIMTWQMPVMFLITGTICMVVGMFLLVWSATSHLDRPELWDDQTKVAIVYTTVAGIAILMFFIGQISLYSPIRG